jgi:hypothetical protein
MLVRRGLFDFYDCAIRIGIKQAVSFNKRTMEIRFLKQTQFWNPLKGIETKAFLLYAALLITRMGLERNGSHTVQWPPLLI